MGWKLYGGSHRAGAATANRPVFSCAIQSGTFSVIIRDLPDPRANGFGVIDGVALGPLGRENMMLTPECPGIIVDVVLRIAAIRFFPREL